MTTEPYTSMDITYRSEGHEVPAVLYQPAESDHLRPGIVLCPGRIRDIDGLAFLARGLVENGFVVLATRYRGMSLASDDADASTALDYLDELAQVDGERLAIVGHSRGAVCALRMTARDDRIRASVAIQPPVDLASIVRAMKYLSPTRYQALIGQLGGTPDENPEQYAALSTLSCADQIHAPVLIIAGSNDLHSPADHCQAMFEAIKKNGNGDVGFAMLDVGHFFERMYYGYEFDEITTLAVEWFGSRLVEEVPADAIADEASVSTTPQMG